MPTITITGGPVVGRGPIRSMSGGIGRVASIGLSGGPGLASMFGFIVAIRGGGHGGTGPFIIVTRMIHQQQGGLCFVSGSKSGMF